MEYKQLHSLRDLLVGVPFVALTATATERCEFYTITLFSSLKGQGEINSFRAFKSPKDNNNEH